MSEPSRLTPNPERSPAARTEGGLKLGGTSRDGGDGPQNVADAITNITDRLTLLVQDEIDLAKAEVSAKIGRLVRGAIVAGVAGIFIVTGLLFLLEGFAWLLYYELPIGSQFTYFWGFFVLAVILVVLGVLAGLIAFRAVKAASPPVPEMAIAEARKIRETVGAGGQAGEDTKGGAGGAAGRGDT